MMGLRKLFRRNERANGRKTSPKVLAVWSPAGSNTARFSLELGQEIALYTTVALAELSCQGIPRLGFISDVTEREKCAETALLELEKTGYLSLSQLIVRSDRLALLPASVYASPDYPVINRISLQTLMDYPVKFSNTARKLGYSTILFECQGQITSPMTFFALKNADLVLLVVRDLDDLAFTLLNVRSLLQLLKAPLQKFCLVGDLDSLALADINYLRDEEGNVLGDLTVIRPSPGEVAELLWPQEGRQVQEFSKKILWAGGQNG